MRENWNRRAFLKTGVMTAATVAASHAVPRCFLLAEETRGANDRVAVGFIGAGGRGTDLFRTFYGCEDVQVTAVADCFKSRRENAARICGGRPMLDFQEMLDGDLVDAVVIATPDHWHVPAALAAAKAKKHVYVEKPLGLTLAEDLECERVLTEAGVVFQYGTQQRSQDNCWLGCECVRQGRIGNVVAVEVDAPDGGAGGDAAEAPIPEDLGADGYRQWLGSAPVKPYCLDRCKTPGTYWIYDQSIGYLGGWGAHPLDILVWGCDADVSGPVTVEGSGLLTPGLYDTVHGWDMKLKLGDVAMTFKPGGDRTRFIGESGAWIEVRRNGTDASSPELLAPLEEGAEILPKRAGRNHVTDFVSAVKAGGTPVSTLRDAVRSDTLSHLCDIAVRTHSVVKWDPVKRELVEPSAEQTKMLSRSLNHPGGV